MKLDLEVRGAVWQGADVHLLARVYKVDTARNQVAAQAADIASIAWSVEHAASGDVLASGTFTVADVMLTPMSTGSIWEEDPKGFNFDAVLAAGNLTRGVTQRVRVTFTTTGTPARTGVVVFRIPAG